MSLSKKYAFVSTLFIALIAALALLPHVARSQSSATPITGYAWSDTIGWVSLNCSSDPSGCSGPAGAWGLSIASNGALSGYAWSDNIGWISANAADVTGCPSSPCTPTISHGAFTGWLKALSANGNGWDGWISLAGLGYGPTLNGASFSGYAWGSNVVGWLSWSLASADYQQCTPAYSCSGETIQYTNASCQVSNVQSCVSPAFCSAGSSSCLYPAVGFNPSGSYSGNLQLIPGLLQSGETTLVHWSVSNARSCTVTGSNGDSWSGLSSPAKGETSKPIVSQTTYTLSCTAYSTNPGVSETETVNVTPAFREM